MASSIASKVFVITGSASGIGYATAVTLLAKGANLALCDINQDGLTKFVQNLDADQKSRVITGIVNVTDRSAITSFLQQTQEKFGRIDGIASIAGTAGHKLGHDEIWKTNEEEYNFIMDINVKGIFNLLSEAFQPGVLRGPASIVHVGSMFSERGFAKGAVYSASKHAIVGLVKSAAIEGGQRGIRVNVVMP